MNSEINILKQNKIFDVVNKPIGQNIVGSRLVFITKNNAGGTLERFQATAIAPQFSQAPAINLQDTFTSVIYYESLRVLLPI